MYYDLAKGDSCRKGLNKSLLVVGLPIHYRFPNGATGIITTWRAVSRARGVTRVRHVLWSAALWGTLRIARKVTRSGARYTGWRRSQCCNPSCGIRSLLWLRTAFWVAIWITLIIACSKTGRNLDWTRSRVEGAARSSATWRVASVWFGAGLCADSVTIRLIKLTGFEVTCWKGNWERKNHHHLPSYRTSLWPVFITF